MKVLCQSVAPKAPGQAGKAFRLWLVDLDNWAASLPEGANIGSDPTGFGEVPQLRASWTEER